VETTKTPIGLPKENFAQENIKMAFKSQKNIFMV
jgi:hypothetical protein